MISPNNFTLFTDLQLPFHRGATVSQEGLTGIVKTFTVPVNLTSLSFVNNMKAVPAWFRHFSMPREARGMSYDRFSLLEIY